MNRLFNDAYYIYVDTQRLLKRMNEVSIANINNRIILNKFDIVLQCILLKISFNNDIVDLEETKFIDKITLEEDILAILNNKLNTSYTWSSLVKIKDNTKMDKLMESILIIFSQDINDFITFLARADGLTEEDYSIHLYNNIKNICNILATVDNDLADLDCVDDVIKEVFFNRYLEVKNLI